MNSCLVATDDCTPIDPIDTHIYADITIHGSANITPPTPYYDVSTRQMTATMSLSLQDQQVSAEAGYTASGQVLIRTNFVNGVDPHTNAVAQTTSAVLTGDVLAEYNASGYRLVDTPPPELESTSPQALIGSTANGDVTAGLLLDTYDTLTIVAAQPTAMGASVSKLVAPLSLPHAVALARNGSSQHTRFNGVPVSVRMIDAGQLEIADENEDGLRAASDINANGIRHTNVHVRRFGRNRGKWVIKEDRTESDDEDVHGKRHLATVLNYRNVRWYNNSARDSARHRLRPSTDAIPLDPSATGASVLRPAPAAAFSQLHATGRASHEEIFCGNVCVVEPGFGTMGSGAGYPASFGTPVGIDVPCQDEVVATANRIDSSQFNIVYQHGFKSNARTWCAMDSYLRAQFIIGNEIRHTLPWSAPYFVQADSLARLVSVNRTTVPGSYIFLGHSNGGILSRYAAQTASEGGGALSLDAFRAVITVSSPHGGAPLAALTNEQFIAMVAFADYAYGLGCDIAATFGCTKTQVAATEVALFVAPYFVHAAVPILDEMDPRASIHDYMNGRPESFVHAAVVNRAWDRWTYFRLAGDYAGCQGGINCGENGAGWVRTTDKLYHRLLECSVASSFLGIVWPGARRAARFCASQALSMGIRDLAYKRVSVGNSDSGDGIVPVRSQQWPGDPGPFLNDDSYSHIAETSSSATGRAIVRAIQVRLNLVPLR